MLHTPGNPISLALTLDGLPGRATQLGSMLFHRGVSGARVVARGAQQTVAGLSLSGFGAHCDAYAHDYLTVAAAVGGSAEEVDVFVERCQLCFETLRTRGTQQGPS